MTCAEVLSAASHARILVVGDICLDRWCHYDPSLSEASRETGIPRCAVVSTSSSPGGGTVAVNLWPRRETSQCSGVRKGRYGHELRQALSVGASRRSADCRRIRHDISYTKLINMATGVRIPKVDFVKLELACVVESVVQCFSLASAPLTRWSCQTKQRRVRGRRDPHAEALAEGARRTAARHLWPTP